MTRDEMIEACARAAHETLRAYRQAQGVALPSWESASEWQVESSRKLVTRLLAGTLDPEAEHNAWMAERLGDGWTWGPERDNSAKTNPLLKPWADLSAGERGATEAQIAALRGLVAHFGLT